MYLIADTFEKLQLLKTNQFTGIPVTKQIKYNKIRKLIIINMLLVAIVHLYLYIYKAKQVMSLWSLDKLNKVNVF